MPPLTNASDAVALLTVRSGEPDTEALRLVLDAITSDIGAWPSVLWLSDLCLHLLDSMTDDVPAAIRSIAVAVA